MSKQKIKQTIKFIFYSQFIVFVKNALINKITNKQIIDKFFIQTIYINRMTT